MKGLKVLMVGMAVLGFSCVYPFDNLQSTVYYGGPFQAVEMPVQDSTNFFISDIYASDNL